MPASITAFSDGADSSCLSALMILVGIGLEDMDLVISTTQYLWSCLGDNILLGSPSSFEPSGGQGYGEESGTAKTKETR